MRYNLLLEYNRQVTASSYGKKLLANMVQDGFFYADVQGLPDAERLDKLLSALEDMDPTPNKQYTQWLVKEYIKNQFRVEDAPRVTALLSQFKQLKTPIVRAGHSADINRYGYRDLVELIDTITRVDLADMPATTLTKKYENADSIRVISKSAYGELLVPETVAASCELGKGTKWCTAWGDLSRNMFERYNSQGPLYVWIDRSGDKYQFHWESKQFMDSSDQPISLEKMTYFRKEHPVLKKLFQKFEEKMLSEMRYTSGIFRYIDKYIKERWPSAEPKMLENAPFNDLVSYAIKYVNEPWPEFEDLVLSYYSNNTSRFDIHEVFRYAIQIKDRSWPELERIVLRHSEWARLYALYLVDGRWRRGEPVIFSNPFSALEYATSTRNNSTKERIPEAEDIIMVDAKSAFDYATDFLNERWPEAEPTILRDARYAKLYTNYFDIDWEDEILTLYPHVMPYTRLYDIKGEHSQEVYEKAVDLFSVTETPVLEVKNQRLILHKWNGLEDFVDDIGSKDARWMAEVITGSRDLFSLLDLEVTRDDIMNFLQELIGYMTPDADEYSQLLEKAIRKYEPEFDIKSITSQNFAGSELYEYLEENYLDDIVSVIRSAVLHGQLMGAEQEMYNLFYDELNDFDPDYGTLIHDARNNPEDPIYFAITTTDLYRVIKKKLGDDEEELDYEYRDGITAWTGEFKVKMPYYGFSKFDEDAAKEDLVRGINEDLPDNRKR